MLGNFTFILYKLNGCKVESSNITLSLTAQTVCFSLSETEHGPEHSCRIIIIIKGVTKCKISSVETILSVHTHRYLHTLAYRLYKT